jgi:hypothetical protein
LTLFVEYPIRKSLKKICTLKDTGMTLMEKLKSIWTRIFKLPIEDNYPSYILNDAQLGVLMGTGAVNVLKKDGSILVRIIMEKKP